MRASGKIKLADEALITLGLHTHSQQALGRKLKFRDYKGLLGGTRGGGHVKGRGS